MSLFEKAVSQEELGSRYLCLYIHIYIYINMYIYMCICMHIYVHIYIHTYIRRLLSSLLSGLDRAFPYLDNKDPIATHVNSLFRIVHSASFSTSTRALMLISHIALAGNGKSSVETTGKVVSEVSNDEGHLVSR
jgi:hypothetical protein